MKFYWNSLLISLLITLSLRNFVNSEYNVQQITNKFERRGDVVVLERRHGDHGDHDHDHDHDHGHDHNDHEGLDHDSSPQESSASRCGRVEDAEDFDLPLHIGAIFLMLVVGSAGCLLTGTAKKISFVQIPPFIIDIGRHFGTGVIISTAFIHMLMASISNLTSPCAPEVFQRYISFGPLLAMVAGFAMHFIEMVVLSQYTTQFNSNDSDEFDISKKEEVSTHNSHTEHNHFLMVTERKVSTYILEFGILAHSIFIGLALGVSSGKEFTSLLIAICFHQFFEGIGLGARISELEFNSKIHPILMILFFSITTPFGMSIGVGIHSSYSATSTTALVVQGVFDALSAGILIYTGFADLMGKEMSITSEFGRKPWSTKIVHLLSLYTGAAVMAVIGVWA